MPKSVKPDPVASPTPGTTALTWDEAGLEAMPGWVICVTPSDGPKMTPGGLHVVQLNKETRPTEVIVVAVGPPVPLPDGRPGHPLVVKKGDRILVPEYGVKVHENPKRGDLRCYEFSQVLARLDP